MQRDQNRVTTLGGISNADGKTAIAITADPVTHAITFSLPLGTMPLVNIASRDNDRVTTVLGASNSDQSAVSIGANAPDGGIFLQGV